MLGENTMTYRIRENGRKTSVFKKCNRIEQQLKEVLPELERPMLLRALSKCRLYYGGNLYYGRRHKDDPNIKREKRKLTEIEKIIYQWLLKNNYNPSTTYRWFLATRIPNDVKEKLEAGKIPLKQAMMISANRRRVKYSNQGLLMLEEMRIIVRGL